jgi:hypothetical protein
MAAAYRNGVVACQRNIGGGEKYGIAKCENVGNEINNRENGAARKHRVARQRASRRNEHHQRRIAPLRSASARRCYQRNVKMK